MVLARCALQPSALNSLSIGAEALSLNGQSESWSSALDQSSRSETGVLRPKTPIWKGVQVTAIEQSCRVRLHSKYSKSRCSQSCTAQAPLVFQYGDAPQASERPGLASQRMQPVWTGQPCRLQSRLARSWGYTPVDVHRFTCLSKWLPDTRLATKLRSAPMAPSTGKEYTVRRPSS